MSAVFRSALVVDADSSIRALLVMFLSDVGFVVSTAISRQEALDRIAAEPPCVVLIELEKAGMTGQGLLACLRDAGNLVPVVFMGDPQVVRAEAHQGGANGYLDKPFDLDAVEQVVGTMCRHADAGGLSWTSRA